MLILRLSSFLFIHSVHNVKDITFPPSPLILFWEPANCTRCSMTQSGRSSARFTLGLPCPHVTLFLYSCYEETAQVVSVDWPNAAIFIFLYIFLKRRVGLIRLDMISILFYNHIPILLLWIDLGHITLSVRRRVICGGLHLILQPSDLLKSYSEAGGLNDPGSCLASAVSTWLC